MKMYRLVYMSLFSWSLDILNKIPYTFYKLMSSLSQIKTTFRSQTQVPKLLNEYLSTAWYRNIIIKSKRRKKCSTSYTCYLDRKFTNFEFCSGSINNGNLHMTIFNSKLTAWISWFIKISLVAKLYALM